MVAAFFSWYSVERAINVFNSSTWLAPMAWFFLLFTLLCLEFVLVKNRIVSGAAAVVSCALSLVFAPSLVHLGACFFGISLIFLAEDGIKKDLELNIKIDLGKTIRTGKSFLVLALAVLITSQYYFSVRDSTAGKVPKFELGGISETLTPRILSAVNPSFKNIESEDLTVDQFILQIEESQKESGGLEINDGDLDKLIGQPSGAELTSQQRELIKKDALEKMNQAEGALDESKKAFILQEGRKKFSEIAGRELTGTEKMSVVFSDAINNKISDYFQPSLAESGGFPLLPMVFSLILLLTIIPLGSFLSRFSIYLCRLVFWIMVKRNYVMIEKVMMEVERIT